jgi:hypothetical protein
MVAASIQWAQRILAKIDSVLAKTKSGGNP